MWCYARHFSITKGRIAHEYHHGWFKLDGCIAESIDRSEHASGRWACGLNCFSQGEALSNHNSQGDMESWHKAGVPVTFVDGHVSLLSLYIDTQILGALCTRNGREPISESFD